MTCGFRPPTHFPRDCPPLPHTELSGRYIRLVYDSRGPTAEDFRSLVELGHSPSRSPRAHCRDCALSLFGSLEKARNALVNQPEIGPRHAAEVVLTGGHGVVQQTGDPRSGHFEWWVPVGVEPLTYYTRMV